MSIPPWPPGLLLEKNKVLLSGEIEMDNSAKLELMLSLNGCGLDQVPFDS
jgi:hypothetical protein